MHPPIGPARGPLPFPPIAGPYSGRIAPLALAWPEDARGITLSSIARGGPTQRQIEDFGPECGSWACALGLASALVLIAGLVFPG